MSDLLSVMPVATQLAKSKMHKYQNPADVLFIISVGNALGLNEATALMNIYNVDGIPSMKADLKLALAKNHPEYNGCTIESTAEKCTVKMSRKLKSGAIESITSTFTIEDARRANLLRKDNWKYYPQRMLKARAVSYAVNDLFPDIVFGMMSQEEAVDLADEKKKNIIDGEIVQYEPDENMEESTPEPNTDAEAEKDEPPYTELPQELQEEFKELMKATQSTMSNLVVKKIDNFDNDIRRHRSIREHLEVDNIKDCVYLEKLKAYHDHLAGKLKSELQPTIKQRQEKLMERLGKLANVMEEEKEEWSGIIGGATRHARLDEAEKWISEREKEL